jgi:UDP:flavonoid glycosyltransferase YjiC (YdhE family)
MSKVLFLNQPSTGHMNVLLTIALQMRDEGHRVSFLVPGTRMNIVPDIDILKSGAEIPKTIENHGIPSDVPVVGMAGRIQRWKRV